MALPITCPKCKAQNPAGAMFCSACGQPLQQAHAAPNVCSSCGAQLAPGARFCSSCGTSIQPAAAPHPQKPQQPVKAPKPQQKEEYVDAAEYFAADKKRREEEARAEGQQAEDRKSVV